MCFIGGEYIDKRKVILKLSCFFQQFFFEKEKEKRDKKSSQVNCNSHKIIYC